MPMLTQHIQRLTVGYRYWVTTLSRHGHRHTGVEMVGVMDDFGNLVGV
jgi:hypothetical protein